MNKHLASLFMFIFILSLTYPLAALPQKSLSKAGPPVYVIFWFDYEDYISGQPSNEAAVKIAEIMKKNGVKAVFKVVGVKAEEIERKNLISVITALSYHEIGFHSYNHSIHPTIGEYLKGKGMSEGISEFRGRESRGLKAVERVFGRPCVCYGQPGSAWAPQVYPVLKEWGINLYLDEGDHVGIDNQPFWYMGLLNVYRMRSTVIKLHALASQGDLETAKEKAKKAWALIRKRGGGIISTYSHPQEFVTQVYWDRLNFKNGQNTSPQEWQKPPLRSQDEIEQSFNNLEAYTQYLLSFPGVRPIRPKELLTIYEDHAPEVSFSPENVLELARAVQNGISFVIKDDFSLSPAEVLSVMVNFLTAYNNLQQIPEGVRLISIFKGPARRVLTNGKKIRVNDFNKAVSRLKKLLERKHQIPDFIEVSGSKISPADFLATLGWLVEKIISGEKLSPTIELIHGCPFFERYVWSKDVWQWSIFPKGFTAPDLIELAKLQAWTLKPAVFHPQEKP
ncbi:MAG: polysaccharide deacetylase family protein [Candidatus Aminicenantales bacterium]